MTGNIAVRTMTTGASFDANGYMVTVDLLSSRSIPTNGSTTFNVLTGAHTVELSGVASNCTVIGGSTRLVTVLLGGTVNADFSISCAPTGPTTGNLTISAATTGPSPDPDGYIVTVNGGNSRTIAAPGGSTSTTYTGVPPGSYSVALNALAGNCTVGGPNPRLVSVAAGNTASTTFSVSCAPTGPTTGNLTVGAATSGPSPDPDGYVVTVDGGHARTIPITGSTTYSGVPPGNYLVALNGLAGNCTVSGPNPRPVNVTAGNTTSTSFAVSCGPTTGNVTVRAATTGAAADLDPDGYTVTKNGGTERTIPINGSTTYFGYPPGSYLVALNGVAGNCTVSGPNPRQVPITAGNTASTTFFVSCGPRGPTTGSLAVGVTTTGSGLDPDGYMLTLDGSTSRALPTNGGSTLFTGLAPGGHSLTLSGVAGNCSVIGGPSRMVSVTAGSTASTSFSVSCGATTPPPPPPPPPPGGARITGVGAIGGGSQTFDFDATDAPGGRLRFTDVSRGATLTVDRATFPTTGITSFTRTSSACVTFGGTGRVDTNGEFVSFSVDACDNGSPGVGRDVFTMSVPSAAYRASGTLTSGDITATGGGGGSPPPTGTRVIGRGAIGTGPATPGSDRLEFDFDVTSAPGGRLFAIDYSVVRASGSAGNMTATSITSLTRTSATCVRIGGMGHLDTNENFQFFVDVCDNASPGAGSDTFTVTIPNRGGPGRDFRHSGTVSAGDIAITSSTS